MSERVKPLAVGDRFKHVEADWTTKVVGFDSVNDPICDDEFDGVSSKSVYRYAHTLTDGRNWRRLSPADTGPQVGEVWRAWRANTGDMPTFTLAKLDEDMPSRPGQRWWKDTCGRLWSELDGTLPNCTRISPAPRPAAPMVGPAKCGRLLAGMGTKTCNREPHSDNNCCYTHALGCNPKGKCSDPCDCWPGPASKPAPAAPTGTPGPKQHPCVSCGKVTATFLRWWKTAPEPTRWCDPCYLQAEGQIAAKHINRVTIVSPPLPRDHWRPAIESLGGVRPFGRPRGWR